MAESTKQHNFRISEEVAEEFRKICAESGFTHSQGFERMIKAYELANAADAIPDRKMEIDEFAMHLDALARAFTNSLQICNDADERATNQVRGILERKQARIEYLETEIENMKSNIEAAVAEKLMVEKERDSMDAEINRLTIAAEEKDRTIRSLQEALELEKTIIEKFSVVTTIAEDHSAN